MSRDPKRVSPFLEMFGAVWSDPVYADERFGQFVMNLTRDESGSFQDPWNWEESDWEQALKRRWHRADLIESETT